MNRSKPAAIDFLVDRIRQMLSQGVTAGPALCRYVDSMHGGETMPDTIAGIEEDADDCSLVDLIFSPDLAFQIEIEPFLRDLCIEPHQIQAMADALLAHRPVTTVRFPSEARPAWEIPMPSWVARSFIDRLHMDYTLPKIINSAIETHVPGACAWAVRVMFRNRRPRLPTPKALFIRDFLNGADSTADDFMACLDFLLSVLDEFDDASDIVEKLIEKKRFYHRHLREARQMSDRLARANVEILLLSGVRIHPIHPEEAREKMAWIDRITLAAAGRVEWIAFDQEEFAYDPTDLSRL